MTIQHLLSNPRFVGGSILVLAFVLVAVAAPMIAPPNEEDAYVIPSGGIALHPTPPSAEHPLGMMEGKRDVVYGLVWGTRVAFKIGLPVAIGRALIGVMVGLISGYYGGPLDSVLMRITDAFLAFPIMAAVLVMLAFFGGGWLNIQIGGVNQVIVLALILFGWMQYARVMRGNVLSVREEAYVEAAIAIGATDRRIIVRHILPNASQELFVLVASDIGAMVVLAAMFSFIGLSRNQALADWGQMLNRSRNWIIGSPANAFQYWYTYLPPSVAIVLFSIGWNLIGEGLREAVDPRQRVVR